MFQFENTIRGRMNIEKVWRLYSDVSQWSEWDSDMQKVTLEGEFVTGTSGTMFMKGMPPLPFTLNEVEKNKVFVNSSVLGEITVTFGHYIFEEGDEEYALKHTVTAMGPNEMQLQGIGQGIVANIPFNMERLFHLVRIE